MTIALAAAGFAFLIIALTTGSIIWAWACIAICMAGAVLLLVSALTSKRTVLSLDEPDGSRGSDEPGGSREEALKPGLEKSDSSDASSSSPGAPADPDSDGGSADKNDKH